LASPELKAIEPRLRRVRRVLEGPQGPRVQEGGKSLANFSSNDYLGLANHPRLREAAVAAIAEYGVGSGASPLVTGHSRLHEEAEAAFADFVSMPRSLLFGSGYAANLGILATLADRHAEIFADRLNHACLNDGALLSRARLVRYPHCDLDALSSRLAASKAPVRIVATDAVFSMDGDVAPLAALAALAERHAAWLVIDDAHGVGVLGRGGRGTLDEAGVKSPRIVHMATLGKALGGHGAFVSAEPQVIEALVQRARTYIYSTALPAVHAGVAIAALELLREDGSIVPRLHGRIRGFRDACARVGVALSPSRTAIQPLVLGTAERALERAERLRGAGFLVPAIRPPTVPEGTSRLRISLSAAHDPRDLEALAGAIAKSLP
jgi:8-amino-7-oxononanoate synthase